VRFVFDKLPQTKAELDALFSKDELATEEQALIGL